MFFLLENSANKYSVESACSLNYIPVKQCIRGTISVLIRLCVIGRTAENANEILPEQSLLHVPVVGRMLKFDTDRYEYKINYGVWKKSFDVECDYYARPGIGKHESNLNQNNDVRPDFDRDFLTLVKD